MDTNLSSRSTFVVSLRSRGLASVEYSSIFQFRQQFVNFFVTVVDTFNAAVNNFTCMSWNAWIALVICLIVAGRSTDLKESRLPQVGLFIPFFAFVVLPCLMMLGWVVWRRDCAVSVLGKVKVLSVSLLLQASSMIPPSDSSQALSSPNTSAAPSAATASKGAPTTTTTTSHQGPSPNPDASTAPASASGDTVRHAAGTHMRTWPAGSLAAAAQDHRNTILAVIEDLHAYLAHNRPYARHFFLPLNSSTAATRGDTLVGEAMCLHIQFYICIGTGGVCMVHTESGVYCVSGEGMALRW